MNLPKNLGSNCDDNLYHYLIDLDYDIIGCEDIGGDAGLAEKLVVYFSKNYIIKLNCILLGAY